MNYEDVTFKQLQEANETIKTTNIKGKEYAEVNQRIKAFRMVYPAGFIRTAILSNEDGVCVMRAEVGFGDTILGTGTAYEVKDATNINRTSYIENCETSAVGRALGMAGFGIDTSVASAEEVTNAIAQQEVEAAASKTIDDAKVAMLMSKLSENDIPVAKVLELYNVQSLSEMTVKKWKNALDNIAKIKEKCAES